MKHFSPDKIKNIALLGHGNSGKSTLTDAILYSAGLLDRIGRNADSTLTTDFDPEEKKRHVSLSTAIYPVEYNETKINLIDAPGLFDFAGGVSEALTAADSALIVLSGKSGLSVGAELAYENAKKRGKPVAFFIGKLDSSHASFRKVLSQLTGKYGAEICPIIMPIMDGDEVFCYVNLIDQKPYKFDNGKAVPCDLPIDNDVANLRAVMLESIASADEELMDKYFEGTPFTEEEIISGLSHGMASGELCPVFCGVGQTGDAVPFMLDILSKIAPAASGTSVTAESDGELIELTCDENGPLAAIVFKTIADPFVGKLSYFKVISGKLSSDSKIVCSRTGNEERVAKVMIVKCNKQEDADYIGAGDIGSVAKLSGLLTGDTICAPGSNIKLDPISFPQSCLSMAIFAKKKGDEEKIAAGLQRLCEEDPTLKFETNKETHESILSGLGEQHLDVAVSKLKNKFGVEVDMAQPTVAYRETIRKKVKVQGRHKKQSGGHGQFGDVWIEFEPCDCDDLIFEEKVFGGAVPKNFFPAVEKGLRDCISHGVLAGYPMVGLKATLVDGSYHPVDSSEMSFKMAAAIAYKAGIPDANPVLLEPIGTLKVMVPDDNMGDVIGDINKRRGRVLGMNPCDNRMQEIVAEVPMGEMGDFSTAMRSITQGRSTFTLEFERYEDAPPMIAQKVIAAAEKE